MIDNFYVIVNTINKMIWNLMVSYFKWNYKAQRSEIQRRADQTEPT